MKKLNYGHPKGMPFSQDRLAEMQDTYLQAINALTVLAGNNCIVSGCTESGSNVYAGWVILNGELLPFKGGSKSTYLVKKETGSKLTYQDGVQREAIFEMEAVFTTSATNAIKWADMKRISDLLGQKSQLDSLSTALGSLVTEVGKKATITEVNKKLDSDNSYVSVFSIIGFGEMCSVVIPDSPSTLILEGYDNLYFLSEELPKYGIIYIIDAKVSVEVNGNSVVLTNTKTDAVFRFVKGATKTHFYRIDNTVISR